MEFIAWNQEHVKCMADFYWATQVTRVTRVPIKHPRSLAHVTLLDINKQDQLPRPLPRAIVVWRGFTWVITSVAVTSNWEHRPLLHEKLIKHYTTQPFKYGLKLPYSMNYNLRPRRWTSLFTHWTDYFILFIYIRGLSPWSWSSLFSWITLVVLHAQRKPNTKLELRE